MSETENGSQRKQLPVVTQRTFFLLPLFLGVFKCDEFNYCARRLSSLCVEASCLFLKNIQGAKDARLPWAGRGLHFAMVTCCHMRRGRGGRGGKINWQLNDAPCENDKRHLVAQEEVCGEGLCNEGLMTIHKRFSVH